MTSLGLFAILLTLAAVFGVVNARTLRLPTTIGVLVFALLASLVMLAINPLIPGYDLRVLSRQFLDVVDLPHTLLNGALSFLLFAGALQVDLTVLLSRKLAVLALALIATLLAVFLFGGADSEGSRPSIPRYCRPPIPRNGRPPIPRNPRPSFRDIVARH